MIIPGKWLNLWPASWCRRANQAKRRRTRITNTHTERERTHMACCCCWRYSVCASTAASARGDWGQAQDAPVILAATCNYYATTTLTQSEEVRRDSRVQICARCNKRLRANLNRAHARQNRPVNKQRASSSAPLLFVIHDDDDDE